MSPSSVLLLIVVAFVVHRLTKRKKKRGRKWFFSPRKAKPKKSWYWGNKRWSAIRERRKEENRTRYRLPQGTCRCERCGENCKSRNIHIDHIYPRKPYWFLQYCYWNTQVLCGTCNTKKSNKLDGHNWRRLRQLRLHPIAWYLRKRQEARGIR